MEDLKFLSVFPHILASDFLRYFIPAGLAYLTFWILLKQFMTHKFIQEKRPKTRQLWFEFSYSMSTVFIFAIIGLGIVTAKDAGITQIYEDFGTFGLTYFLSSILLMIVFHDTYFYWTHRWMHLPGIFRHVHAVHHRSTNPSPWAAYSFHPLEALVQAMVLPIIIFILPVHPLAIFIFLVYMITRNVLGHLGLELFPQGFVNSKWFNWHTTTTHHHMHHQYNKCHYGLYFSWWDDLMETTHDRYEEKFNEVSSKPRKSYRLISAIPLVWTTGTFAQNPEGKWTTYDDATGEELSIVRIFLNPKQNTWEGEIDSILLRPNHGEDPNCSNCSGARKNQPVIGMNILWGFEKIDHEWKNGHILDPANGVVYTSKIVMSADNKLMVRGFGGPFDLFYRTQTWRRVTGSAPSETVEGLWETIDDRYSQVKSIVKLEVKEEELVGRVQKIFLLPHEGNYPLCVECHGDLQDTPIVGIRFMWGFKRSGDEWSAGQIMDPGNGKTYASSFWLTEENKLKVRGYWGPFFRTQEWERSNE